MHQLSFNSQLSRVTNEKGELTMHITWERFLQGGLCQLVSQYKADLLNPGKSEGSTLLVHFLSKSVERDPHNKIKILFKFQPFERFLGPCFIYICASK